MDPLQCRIEPDLVCCLVELVELVELAVGTGGGQRKDHRRAPMSRAGEHLAVSSHVEIRRRHRSGAATQWRQRIEIDSERAAVETTLEGDLNEPVVERRGPVLRGGRRRPSPCTSAVLLDRHRSPREAPKFVI